MSTSTVKSSSSSSAGSQSGTEVIDNSIFIHELPNTQLNLVYDHLNQNDVWEEAARQMGYSANDIFVSFCFEIRFCLPFAYMQINVQLYFNEFLWNGAIK